MIIQTKWWQHGCVARWARNAEDEGFWKQIDCCLLSRRMEHTEYGPGQTERPPWPFYLGEQPLSYGLLEKDVNTSSGDCFGERFHVKSRTCLLNEAWESSGVQIKDLCEKHGLRICVDWSVAPYTSYMWLCRIVNQGRLIEVGGVPVLRFIK